LPAIYTDSKDKKTFESSLKLLDMLGLSERVKHRPSEVSGGQQRRAAIAKSLLGNKMHSILSVLEIIMGFASLITMSAIVNGAKRDIANNVSGIRTVRGGCQREQLNIATNGKNYNTTLIGASTVYANLKNYYISNDRFFKETGNREKKKVKALDKTVIKKLY
jgi:macrolide transport system ATP-binding/permease protein